MTNGTILQTVYRRSPPLVQQSLIQLTDLIYANGQHLLHLETIHIASQTRSWTKTPLDPKHSNKFTATFTTEHMPKMAYPSSSVDPEEYSPGSTQKFFDKATANDTCPMISPEFDSSWRDDPVEVKVKEDIDLTSTYCSEDDGVYMVLIYNLNHPVYEMHL
jgi:hypothetical protein